jgi:hypothetical protein
MMANIVNRSQNGPPTQGRRGECARRLRQQRRREEKRAKVLVGQDAEVERLVHALDALAPEELARLTCLDDAQLGYLELEIDRRDAEVGPGANIVSSFEIHDVPNMATPEDCARAILKAVAHE